MSPTQEARLLRKVLRRCDQPPRSRGWPWWGELVVWALLAAFFFVLLRIEGGFQLFLVAIVSILVGCLITSLSFVRAALIQWPFLRPHISRESVAARLTQLEP